MDIFGGGNVANAQDIIDIFLGSFKAEPTEGRRPLLVHFTGEPEIDLIIETETGNDYIIIENENSPATIAELEVG